MANNREKKERRFTLNIGVIIFGAIFVYLLITLHLYLSTDHVSSYMVTSGTLSNNESYTALALRTETVATATASGYVNYYVQNDSKASKDDVICSISDAQTVLSTENLAEADINTVRSLASAFSAAYDEDNFEEVYDLLYTMNSTIISDSDNGAISGTVIKSVSDGVITYTMDGYEDYDAMDVTEDLFTTKAYSSTQLRTDEAVSAGDSLYRIVSSDTWELIFPVSDRQYAKLSSKSSIKVKFAKDGQTETGDLTLFDKDNVHYAQITLYSGMVRYCDNRFLEIELVTNTESGLKIPISAIVTKEFYVIPTKYLASGGEDSDTGFLVQTTDENGNVSTTFVDTDLYEDTTMDDGTEVYYVDEGDFEKGDIIVLPDSSQTYTIGETASLEGVYCTNLGYAQFRKISIIDQNEEYCIVEEGTDYGISQYDYIVRDGSTVDESQILR